MFAQLFDSIPLLLNLVFPLRIAGEGRHAYARRGYACKHYSMDSAHQGDGVWHTLSLESWDLAVM